MASRLNGCTDCFTVNKRMKMGERNNKWLRNVLLQTGLELWGVWDQTADHSVQSPVVPE